MIEASKKLPAWRKAIIAVLIPHRPPSPHQGACTVELEFVLHRPLSTPKRSPTPAVIKKPDTDKLIRAVLDSITLSGMWRDDSQAIQVLVCKRIAEINEPTGCMIMLTFQEPS